jgi:hypothetical protein
MDLSAWLQQEVDDAIGRLRGQALAPASNRTR